MDGLAFDDFFGSFLNILPPAATVTLVSRNSPTPPSYNVGISPRELLQAFLKLDEHKPAPDNLFKVFSTGTTRKIKAAIQETAGNPAVCQCRLLALKRPASWAMISARPVMDYFRQPRRSTQRLVAFTEQAHVCPADLFEFCTGRISFVSLLNNLVLTTPRQSGGVPWQALQAFAASTALQNRSNTLQRIFDLYNIHRVSNCEYTRQLISRRLNNPELLRSGELLEREVRHIMEDAGTTGIRCNRHDCCNNCSNR